MFEVTTSFSRVFDIVPGGGGTRRWPWQDVGDSKTAFGFEDATGIHFNVAILGKPSIKPGMRITALLEREGDWDSLLGWVDHATGEIAGPSLKRRLVAADIIAAVINLIGASQQQYVRQRLEKIAAQGPVLSEAQSES